MNLILAASDLVPVFDKEIYLTDYESGTHAIQNQIIMYTRWFIDQVKMQEDQPSVFSFPTALFNLLDSQYNQLNPDLINKPWYKKVLTNIYELCIEGGGCKTSSICRVNPGGVLAHWLRRCALISGHGEILS